MNIRRTIKLAVIWLAMVQVLGAQEAALQNKKIVISAGAVTIDGTDLRGTDAKKGKSSYYSLPTAEKALGQPTEKYQASRVSVYSWHGLGVVMQQGGRGPEKGKLFKFQVYLHEGIDQDKKHSGAFAGHVMVDGIDLSAATKFDAIRGELEKQGYAIKTSGGAAYAEKGSTQIFTVEPPDGDAAKATNEIQRVEVWSGE